MSGPVGSEPFAAPAAFGMAPEGAEIAEDDVRVAGSAARPGSGGAGDTGHLPPLGSAFPGATEVISSDEPAAPSARRPRQGRRSAGRRPASVSGSSRSGSSGRTGLKVAVAAAGAVVVLGGGAAAFALTGSDSGSSKGKASSSGSTNIASDQAKAAMPALDPAKVEAQRKKLAIDRASRANRDGGDSAKLMPKGKPVPSPTPSKSADPSGGGGGGNGGGGGPSGDPVPAGQAQQIAKGMLPSFGFSGSGQFGCLVKLWNRESGWNTHASNSSSGAYGIPQALPGNKMASAGSDWQNSASTQIKWGLGYIKNRYGTPCGAWAHSQSTGWY
ncbi:lytic transglycosylase domain-containing protein [Spirillospora sp. NPDC052269]